MSLAYKPVTLNCSCWRHIINILLTELSRSVWENLDLGRVYRPHCVRSVLTTSVKILPYSPPARLIRAKYFFPRAIFVRSLKILLKSSFKNAQYLFTEIDYGKTEKRIFNASGPETESGLKIIPRTVCMQYCANTNFCQKVKKKKKKMVTGLYKATFCS